MPITNSKQNWATGQIVKVGFMKLEVIAMIPTPDDYAPDAYHLRHYITGKKYTFVPHNGLTCGWDYTAAEPQAQRNLF